MSITAWIALSLFLIIYIVISTEKINKTIVALMGGAVFITLEIIGQEEAFHVIDWNVIFLLISMMVIINITKTTGLFQYVAIKTAKSVQGNPLKILILLTIITAVFSAFLDNVTTMLILSPVTILIAVELGISPAPFIICMAIGSNIGGTATLIGDPPNIMIGSAANLQFINFLAHLGPVIIIILAVFVGLMFLLFRKQMTVSNERKARIMDFDESKSLTDKPLLIRCVAVLGLVIIGFLLHGLLGLEASTVALFGAALLLLISGKHEPEEFFRDIEWGTIFFFIGLFIMVGGLVEQGWIKKCSQFLLSLTKGDLRYTSVLLVWVSGIFSAIVDNIPYVATMIPMVQDIAASVGPDAAMPLWWSLALGACLGGNATLVGASANVVSAGISTKNGYPITFMDFTKYGLAITLISLALSTGYVLLRYF
ncbi:MAG: ArsB/NhaD family transporter [Spirochaetaceae bacterium]|jgi:Na+/H+ antiporter NhaD/arsenite permease-like protein|nr:ArsB/NhaD family transporter [Spirochaetaceae bacterium]